jgi:hypothetical protein
MKTVIKGQIIGGNLDLRSSIQYNKAIYAIGELEGEEEKNVLITIETLKDIDKYRAEYFALVDELRFITGYTKAETHDIFKNQILRKKLNKTSTTKLEVEEWPTYLVEVRNYIFDNLDLVI